MFRKQTSISIKHKRQSKPPLPPKFTKSPIEPEPKGHTTQQISRFMQLYYHLKDIYNINGSLQLLHYYFRDKCQQSIQEENIDLGIQYIQSEQVDQESYLEQQFKSEQKQSSKNKDACNDHQKQQSNQENFTDQQNDHPEELKQSNQNSFPVFESFSTSPQKPPNFGTKRFEIQSHIIQSYQQQQKKLVKEQQLRKTAYFSQENDQFNEQQDSIYAQPEIKVKVHRRCNTVAAHKQNINNGNAVSMKLQLLDKIQKQKQKKQLQWNKYMQRDKQYLQKFLK